MFSTRSQARTATILVLLLAVSGNTLTVLFLLLLLKPPHTADITGSLAEIFSSYVKIWSKALVV